MDIFAIVMDFWSAYSEPYSSEQGRSTNSTFLYIYTTKNSKNNVSKHTFRKYNNIVTWKPSFGLAVRQVIFRESFTDYEATAGIINAEYDAAMINFKLGALGGTACAYSVCLVKSIRKPVISVVHSIHHNMDDALQV